MEFRCIGSPIFKFPPTSEVSHACAPTYHEKRYETVASSVLREKAAKKEGFTSGTRWEGRRQKRVEKGMTGEKEERRRNYRKNYSRDAIVRIATETAAAFAYCRMSPVLQFLPSSRSLCLRVRLRYGAN